MTIYYFSEDKKGYYEGPLEEAELHHKNYILVEKCPGQESEYNFSQRKWVLTESSLHRHFSSKRMAELRRVSIYKDAKALKEEQKTQRDNYINELWNLDFTSPSSFSFPVCPLFMQE